MDISSTYAGLDLASPVVIGASPLALDPGELQRLVVHGAGAVVMPSIFEEQIRHDELSQTGFAPSDVSSSSQYPDMLTFLPQLDRYNGGATSYLRNLEAARAAVDIPIIASVNCVTCGSWMQYAERLESAGADAVELNLYHYEVDPHRFAEEVERDLVDRVDCFLQHTHLPVSVKLLPRFTCLANIAYRIAGTGAKSLCLFGQTPALSVVSKEEKAFRWRLTAQSDFRVTAEGIQTVAGAVHNLTLAASGGIQSAEDAVNAIQVGAHVVMITSAIYQRGATVIEEIHSGIRSFLETKKLAVLRDLVGSEKSGFNPYLQANRRQEYAAAVSRASATEMG